jgi:L-lysine 2,3-aminomutase
VQKDVSKEYKKAVKILKKAYIYVHRLGVFENGIDNEAEFLALLEKNLDEMKEN